MKTEWIRAVRKARKAALGVPQRRRKAREKERAYSSRFLSRHYGGAAYRALKYGDFTYPRPVYAGTTEAGAVAADHRARGVKIRRAQQAARRFVVSGVHAQEAQP